jgi:hypothetical protein
MTTAIAIPEIQKEALSLTELAATVLVKDAASLAIAGEYMLAAAALEKKIREHHAPLKATTDIAHKAACAAEAKALAEGPGRVRSILTPQITAYRREVDRLRLEEQARQQTEIRRLAEEERLQIALSAETQGVSQEDVTAILEQPVFVPVVAAPPPVAMPKGISGRKEYTVRVVDLRQLVKAVADGRVTPMAVEPNMKYLNGRARMDRAAFSIPGCELVEEDDLTVRRS